MSMRRVYDPVHDSVYNSEEEVPASPTKRQKSESFSSTAGTSRPRRFSIMSLINDEQQENNAITASDADEVQSSPLKETESTPQEQDSKTNPGTSKSGHIFSNKREPSKYQRNLKKADGSPFTRSDIQYGFMIELLKNDYCIFKNIFKENKLTLEYSKHLKVPYYSNSLKKKEASQDQYEIKEYISSEGSIINHFEKNEKNDKMHDARTWMNNDYLTFGQLYLMTILSSKKTSKILRDKLMTDTNIAFSMCVLSLLVNIGRLNTTNNFFLEMTSQSRTFHTIPVLQHGINMSSGQLQDTPRIKSILKNIPFNNNPMGLQEFYDNPAGEKFNIITILFTICENPNIIAQKFLVPYVELKKSKDEDKPEGSNVGEESSGNATEAHISIFDILDNGLYEFQQRVDILVWLAYVHLETDGSESAIQESLTKFKGLSSNFDATTNKFAISKFHNTVDVDTEEELAFYKTQNVQRAKFLERYLSLKNGGQTEIYELPVESNGSDTLVSASAPKGTSTESVGEQELANDNKPDNGTGVAHEGPTPLKNDQETNSHSTSLSQSPPLSDAQSPSLAETVEPVSVKKLKVKSGASHSVKQVLLKPKPVGYEAENVNINKEKESLRSVVTDSKKNKMTKFGKNLNNMVSAEEERLLNITVPKGNTLLDAGGDISLAQEEFKKKLYESQRNSNKKRQELGYLKIFSEFEDIPMATVLGIRGKKKKKYQDSVLGFETSLMKIFKVGKKNIMQSVMKKMQRNEKPEE